LTLTMADGLSCAVGAPAGGVADAQGDHRMAMAFAIAALAAERPSRVEGADAVAVSYPGFFDTLAYLVGPARG
jgi:3-phosphoshikimate 1-carboxyvinyltransferase